MDHKKVLNKTVEVAGLTATSRVIAVIRASLQLSLLGLTGLSDAFLVAARLPGFLRKILAEGGLSSAFVPEFVRLISDNNKNNQDTKQQAESLMSYSMLFFEGIIGLGVLFVIWYPASVISLIAPGFTSDQVAQAIPLMRIIFPLILFLSSAALLAGPLHAVHNFAVTAAGPILLNSIYMGGLLLCLWGGCGVQTLAFSLLCGGIALFLLHLFYYKKLGFSFGGLTPDGFRSFRRVLSKFLPALLGVSVLEINLLIDGVFGSYLGSGSVTMLHYGSRFMGIPLGVFGAAFATVLLPFFSQLIHKKESDQGGGPYPENINMHFTESIKLSLWVLIPCSGFFLFFAPDIFFTFLGYQTPVAQIYQAACVLQLYTLGLLIFSLIRLYTTVLYALHDKQIVLYGTALMTIANIVGNSIALWCSSLSGIVISTVISGLFLLIYMGLVLAREYKIAPDYSDILVFIWGVIPHLLLLVIGFIAIHTTSFFLLRTFIFPALSPVLVRSFESGVLHWGVIIPITTCSALLYYKTRSYFSARISFLF